VVGAILMLVGAILMLVGAMQDDVVGASP